jgi:hypothetical protein
MTHDIKPVAKAPDIEHMFGKAWLVDISTLRKQETPPPPDATVAMWVVEAPWAHPAWHSYLVFLIHLRKMDDSVETLLYVDGATHEMHVYAMAPEADREALIAGTDIKYINGVLHPVNFAAQFIAADDEAAKARVQVSVNSICLGALSPDTDYRQKWVMLYGDNMMKDREHKASRPVIRRKG